MSVKKHIELDAEEIKGVKEFKKMTGKMTLLKTVNMVLDYVKTKDYFPRYDYISKPSVCYIKPYYIFWGEDIIGKINVDVRNDIITFLHEEKEYSFTWKEMKDRLALLQAIIEDYATDYEGFETLMERCGKE